MGRIDKLIDAFVKSEYCKNLENQRYGYYVDKINKAIIKSVRSRNLNDGKSSYDEIFIRNINMITEFYKSDYYEELCKTGENKKLIKAIVDTLYIDPDEVKTELDDGITLTLDAIISKNKFYFFNNEMPTWLDDYKKYRKMS